MNLVFHVASAVAFLVVLFWVVRLQQQLGMVRHLIQGQWQPAQERPLVNWPDKFLIQFAAALAIPLEIDPGAGKIATNPLRIKPGPLMDLHFHVGIKSMSWSLTDNGQPCLRITLHGHLSPSTRDGMIQTLTSVIPGTSVKIRETQNGSNNSP